MADAEEEEVPWEERLQLMREYMAGYFFDTRHLQTRCQEEAMAEQRLRELEQKKREFKERQVRGARGLLNRQAAARQREVALDCSAGKEVGG